MLRRRLHFSGLRFKPNPKRLCGLPCSLLGVWTAGGSAEAANGLGPGTAPKPKAPGPLTWRRKLPVPLYGMAVLPRQPNHFLSSLLSHRSRPPAARRLPMPRPGQVLGLVGSNGTGKSTALKILAGKLKPNLGRFNVSCAAGCDQ
jgi:hypothetical protein